MGIGPIEAIPKALEYSKPEGFGHGLEVELNEAFAAQSSWLC